MARLPRDLMSTGYQNASHSSFLKEFKEARNGPKDNKCKTFPIAQAIVVTHSHIKQPLEDCRELLNKINLVLVTVNNTTASSWWVGYWLPEFTVVVYSYELHLLYIYLLQSFIKWSTGKWFRDSWRQFNVYLNPFNNCVKMINYEICLNLLQSSSTR